MRSARILPAIVVCVALMLTGNADDALPTNGQDKKVVAYIPNWIDLETFSKTIDYGKLTHIIIAFENPTNDTGVLSFEPSDAILIERAHAGNVKILVSIGGGAAAADKVLKARYFKLLSDDRRSAFVQKLADYVEKHDFDGLDVDIEGPSINEDYGDFIADLSAALKLKGKLLTAALSQGYDCNRVPDAVLSRLDFLNIMAYDATGPWARKKPGQHSSLEFAQAAVKYWTGRGLIKSKVVLGVPFYGYGFDEAFRKDGYSYAGILAAYPEAGQLDQVGSTIWHNSIPTIVAKVRYVLKEDLGGIMIWSLNQDVKDSRSLLSTIHATLTAP